MHLQFYQFGNPAIMIHDAVLRCADEIITMVNAASEDKSVHAGRIISLGRGVTQIVNEIDARNWGQNDFSVHKILSIFRSQTKLFAYDAGYVFLMDFIGIPEAEFYEMDFLYLLTELSTIVVTMFELSSDKKVTATVDIDELELQFKFATTMHSLPYHVINAENIMRLTNHYDCDAVNMVVFDCLLSLTRNRFSYSLLDKKKDNFTIDFLVSLPTKKTLGNILHDRDSYIKIEKEDEAKDMAAIILNSLLNPEKPPVQN